MYTAEQIYDLIAGMDDAELGELQAQMASEEEPGARYDMGGGVPMPNPIAEARPQPGGNELQAQNPALRRLYAQMPRTQGKPVIPGLLDHSNQHDSGQNWHESGGV